jgi:uncharacterized Zn-binding protein involved in type VI secretion
VSKAFIVIGDKTSHGGVVLGGTQASDIGGKPIARIGDKVSCPQRGHGGTTVIVSGDPTCIIDGKPVARHGDKTACGATLLSSQATTTIDAGGGGGGAAKQSPAAALTRKPDNASEGPQSLTDAGAGAEADQHFLLLDEGTKAPLKNRLYRIHANGITTEGRSTNQGKTRLVLGAVGDSVKIEVFAEEAGA